MDFRTFPMDEQTCSLNILSCEWQLITQSCMLDFCKREGWGRTESDRNMREIFAMQMKRRRKLGTEHERIYPLPHFASVSNDIRSVLCQFILI